MTRQFDEEVLLGKVLNVFWVKGWQATSMSDLASAASVQRGSLYHAYGDKERLFLLAFDRYAEQVLAASRAALAAPTARVALQRFFEVSIASMTMDTPPRGCFTTKTAMESGQSGAEIHGRVCALTQGLEAALVEALARDTVRPSLAMSPAEAAKLILAFTRGLAVMERLAHGPEQLQALSQSMVALIATA
ncbi:TetR/AcrR family transcriptional regulator [Pseudoduganella violacea]|uniref:AcrR family transcriptional regulator n=1 Tax=Pseudoduganella violacea TaxID=1715466 RepID=A0A7W5FVH5_9BURK|nr:TetR/AcrR family transcriptional regulator [Pseudoduganella violacea]MBB3120233.1 AcrR family transcriptional regulator [Pseudoduganella violacea]